MHKQEFIVAIGDTSVALRLSDQRQNQFFWNTPRHSNADYELHTILSGSCTVSVEDKQYVLDAGNAILIAPGHYHQPLKTAGDFRKFSVSFFPFAGKIAEAIQQCEAINVISMSEVMQHLAKDLLDEYNKELPFRRELTGAILSQLMVYILRKLSVPESFTAADTPNNWRTDVIDDFFSDELTYGTETRLAERLHLFRRQLSRVMQTHYGMSFRQKMLSSRMERAAWLLRTTDLSIVQVCDNVGYNSEAAFYQNFKSYHGMTPLQYRKLQAYSK